MPRLSRILQPNTAHHVTVRCNNRRFNLVRQHSRDVLLYAVWMVKERFPFKKRLEYVMVLHMVTVTTERMLTFNHANEWVAQG
jgi:putative transposase